MTTPPRTPRSEDDPSGPHEAPRPKLRANRRVERAGVNEARALFEAVGWVFQEVDLGNDYGKDAYVDVSKPGDLVTGLCIALQIKSGESFRTKAGYSLPLKPEHVTVWRESSVPIGVVVFDPSDKQLRWANVSRFLSQQGDTVPSVLPIKSGDLLTGEAITGAFKESFVDLVQSDWAARAVLGLYDEDEDRQVASVFDCFAYGRRNPQLLAAVRYSAPVLGTRAFALLIEGLGRMGIYNPNVFYRADTAPTEATCAAVQRHLTWSIAELIRIIETVPVESWDRSGLGFEAFLLIAKDRDAVRKLEQVLKIFLHNGDDNHANIVLGMALEIEGDDDQAPMLARLVEAIPALASTWFYPEIKSTIDEHGSVSFW